MASGVTVSPGEMGGALASICADFVDGTRRQAQADVRKAGRACLQEVRATSPIRFGGYAAGWAMRARTKGGDVAVYVYQKRFPGLTHLLEIGHMQFVWGRPTGRFTGPKCASGNGRHIEPAYEKGADVLKGAS